MCKMQDIVLAGVLIMLVCGMVGLIELAKEHYE